MFNLRTVIRGADITNLDGLSQVTKVIGDLVIEYNDNLTSLDGLHNIDTVTHAVHVRENPVLTDLQGLSSLTWTEDLKINNNPLLVNLRGLEKVNYIGLLFIGNNGNLESVDGLEGLTDGRVGGSYFYGFINADISGNPNLVSLEGLSNYQDPGQWSIRGNNALTNIDGLRNAVPCLTVLAVTDNPQLSVCNNNLTCTMYGFGNYYYPSITEFSGNAPGCNSIEEILAECNFNIEDYATIDTTVYLRPGETYFWEGANYGPDTLLCTTVDTTSSNLDCYAYRCVSLRPFPGSADDRRQVGCDIEGIVPSGLEGRTLSLSGDGQRLASAYHTEPGTLRRRTIRVFENRNQAWVQIGDDVPGGADAQLSGWGHQLSEDGNTLVVGDKDHDFSRGRVRVYNYLNGNWVQRGQDLTGPDISVWYGESMSINADGNRIAVVAPFVNGPNGTNGATYVYGYDGNAWQAMGERINFLEFGGGPVRRIKLSGSGDRLAISSHSNGQNGFGNTRVFEWDGTDWQQLGGTINQSFPYDWSGYGLDISSNGTTVAIGEPENTAKGNIRILRYLNGEWVPLGADLTGASLDGLLPEVRLGFSVALSEDGNQLAAGAYRGATASGTDVSGAATYAFDGTDWQLDCVFPATQRSEDLGSFVDISTDGKYITAAASSASFVDLQSAGLVRVFRCDDAPVLPDTTIYLCAGASVVVDFQTFTTGTLVCTTRTALINGNPVCSPYCTEIIVTPTYDDSLSITICEGEIYDFDGLPLTRDTAISRVFSSIAGCDSLVYLDLTVVPAVATEETIYQCPDDFSVPQSCVTYVSTLTGCDSVHCINYLQAEDYQTDLVADICAGETYAFNGVDYTVDTAFCLTLPTVYGCDSVLCLDLTVLTNISVNEAATACMGQAYAFDGLQLRRDTTVCRSTLTTTGCDSTYCLTVAFLDTVATRANVVRCAGEPFSYGGQTVTEADVLSAVFTGANGCDSTHYVTVTFLDTSTVDQSIVLCPGDSYTFAGISLGRDTTVCRTAPNLNGCDSTYCVTVAFTDTLRSRETVLRCAAESYTYAGQTVTTDAELFARFVTAEGCDSLHTVNVLFRDTVRTEVAATICPGETYDFAGVPLSRDTIVLHEGLTAAGCDSTYQLTLTVSSGSAGDTTRLQPVICNGEVFTVGSSSYTSSGRYLDVLTAANGCDSLIETALTVVDFTVEYTLDPPSCPGAVDGQLTVMTNGGATPFDYILAGQPGTEGYFDDLTAGTYALQVMDANGCLAEATVTVEDLPEPEWEIVTESSLIYLGDSLRLAGVGTPTGWRAQWSPVAGLACDSCLVTYTTPETTTEYTLTLFGEEGCTTQKSVLIIVDQTRVLYAPTAFSPNDDGLNDRFVLYAGPAIAQVASVTVYDRWGREVFHRQAITPGNTNDGWDGMTNGQAEATGVYVYRAQVQLFDGSIRTIDGEVLLIR